MRRVEWPFYQRPGSTFFIESEEELAPGGSKLALVVGPQHPGSGHMRLFVVVHGDRVVDVKPDPGFVHRGIEKLAERRPFWTLTPLVEKASIVDSVGITLPLVHALEKALGLEPPPRAQYLRLITAELTRIRTHLYDLSIHSIFLGHSTGFMWGFGLGDIIAEALAKLTGARTTASYPVPGGVRRDLTADGRQTLERLLEKLRRKLKDFYVIFFKNPVVKMRLEGVGVLDAGKAAALGAVGPPLRAAGVPRDARVDGPYDAYKELRPEIAVEKEGDAYARQMVRWREIEESIRLIEEGLKSLPEGEILDESLLASAPEYRRGNVAGILGVYTKLRPEPGEHHGLAEAARGAGYVELFTTAAANAFRLRLVTPSWRNLRPMVEAMKGQRLADVPAVYMSFGYFPPEADR